MAEKTKIQPVPPSRHREALRFVVAGADRDEGCTARLAALQAAADRAGREATELWWARRRRRCVAAAMVLARPGRTGMLFRSPADAPGVDRQALSEVVRGIAESALKRLYVVQAFLAPEAAKELAVLEAAGFTLLVELVNLRLELPAWPPAQTTQDRGPWSCRRYGEFDDSELGAVISATYAGSLDCPALCGLRPMADVLAAHKTSGVFRPESWWIFDFDGRAAGCILVNAAGASSDLVEVVYLGVCPSYRGRGLGRRMLRHAIEQVTRDGAAAVKLAVDSRNVYARDIYDQMGFGAIDRTRVMAQMRSAPQEAPE